MSKLNAARFRELADAATPGPWKARGKWGEVETIPEFDAAGDCTKPIYAIAEFSHLGADEDDAQWERDAAFIAACGTERERIYKSLLLMEQVELEANEDGVTAQEMRHWLARVESAREGK